MTILDELASVFKTADSVTSVPHSETSGTPADTITVTLYVPNTVVSGQSSLLQFETSPAQPAVQYALVSGTVSSYAFYSGATGFTTLPLSGGTGSVSVMFENTGDFVKYGPVGGPYVDSYSVSLTSVANPLPALITAASAAMQALNTVITSLSAAIKLAGGS